jgi:hypothetical protein
VPARKLIYVETSIPSFYFETRTSPEAAVMRDWTRVWWDKHRHEHDLCTGDAVLAELSNAPSPKREQTLELIGGVRRLEFSAELEEILAAYWAHKLMPRGTYGDGAHLALASYYNCDWLLTWNCRHLANSNKFEHIDRINALLRLRSPRIITPLHLLGEDYEL